MDDRLAAFLSRQQSACERIVDWGGLPLRLRACLTTELPPVEYISSVRCLVVDADSVLVVENGDERYVLPGGRLEPGESLEGALHREVLEETGIIIRDLVVMGCLHFHHLAPKADGYAYPYPDFLQVVYRARAAGHLPEARVRDPYVSGSGFLPLGEVSALPLSPIDRVFLAAAMDQAHLQRKR